MPLYFERECSRGHQVFGDDFGWCSTCEEDVIPLRITKPEDERECGAEDAMLDAVSFDNRTEDLLYGFNDDSVLGQSFQDMVC